MTALLVLYGLPWLLTGCILAHEVCTYGGCCSCPMPRLWSCATLITSGMKSRLSDRQQVMHAWLRLSGYQRLSMDVEEGLAQLMALLWLERQQPPPVCALWHCVPLLCLLAAFQGMPVHLILSVWLSGAELV